jgi:hypothetical protein
MTRTALLDGDYQVSKPNEEYPLTVREAAKYLGVSPQDRISLGRAKADSPSPRNGSEPPVSQVGYRNIPRFIQTGDGEWLDPSNTMELYIAEWGQTSGGCVTENGTAHSRESPHALQTGVKHIRNSGTGFRPGMEISFKLSEMERI